VTFTLPGFVPQSVPVEYIVATAGRWDPEVGGGGVALSPNPVEVALEPAPPPPTARRKPPRQQRPPPRGPA
jgi:hypothetical protein